MKACTAAVPLQYKRRWNHSDKWYLSPKAEEIRAVWALRNEETHLVQRVGISMAAENMA